MLRIRKEQMEAFGVAMLSRFKASLAQELQERHNLPPEEAKRIVDLGVNRAALYGLNERDEITRYVHLIRVLGEDFDTDERFPWASFILRDPELLPKVKLDLLEAKVGAADRDEEG